MIFVDTSAFFAVLDRDDEFHLAARSQWQRLLAGEEDLATSNYVVIECFALIQRRLGMAAVRAFSGDVLPVVRLHFLDLADHQSAVQMVLTSGRRQLSLVDCSSFQLMRRLRLQTAFAFDKHFSEQGFEILPDLATPTP